MANSLIDRTLSILELMSTEITGISVTEAAERTGLSKGGAHRQLTELARLGYVRQDPVTERYLLTTRLISIGLAYLSASGITEISQPILDRLADESGELIRLSVVDGDTLTWVAKAQGARSGLRYDPDMGAHPMLFCTATGQIWLSTMPDDEALRIVMTNQGFGNSDRYGPNAPRSVADFLAALTRARAEGYASVNQAAEIGASAMAVVITDPRGEHVVGTLSITGPSFRLTEERVRELVPALLAAARELSAASLGSGLFAAQKGRIAS